MHVRDRGRAEVVQPLEPRHAHPACRAEKSVPFLSIVFEVSSPVQTAAGLSPGSPVTEQAVFSPLPHHGAPDPADSEGEDGQGWPTDCPSRKSPRALQPHVKMFFERTVFRVSPLLAIEH